MDDIDIRTLKCFVAVAEELHFARAARALNMSQPPLTKRIQALEHQLGVVLFDRDTRNVTLTRAGAVLLDETRRLFAQSQAMRRAVLQTREGRGGTLRVGFISSAFVAVIQPHLPEFTSTLGSVEYVWTELSSTQQLDALRHHELDLGFVHSPIAHEGLSRMLLANERCLVAIAHTHRLASRSWVRLADLAREEFVIFPREAASGYYDRIMLACREAGFSPSVRHQARHYLTMLLLPASGYGVSIVPASAQRLTTPGLKLLPIRETALRAELSVLWHPDNPSLIVKGMVASLRARELPRAPGRTT